MSREKELVKNAFVLSLGKFLPKLISTITLPILTAYLTKKEYGTYDLITTLIMLVIPVATLQVQSAAFRFLIDSRDNKERTSSIISNIFVVTVPISLIASIIVQFFFTEWNIYIRILISAYFFLDTAHSTIGFVSRGLGNNKDFSIAAIIVSATIMITVVITVSGMKMGLLGVMLAYSLAQLASTVYLICKINLFSYISFNNISISQIKELLSYSWPMVPNNLSSWVLKLSNRLVITNFIGVEANAVYAVANKIPNLLSIAQSVIVMAWQENASIVVESEDVNAYYTKMLDKIFKITFGCTVLLIATTPILFKLLIKGDYADAYYQMPILILAMFFYVMSSFFGGIYIAHKKTVSVGVSTMVAAGINLAINLSLVNLIGVFSASISTLVAYIILYLYRMLDCQKFQKIGVDYKNQIVLILIMIVLLVSCFMQKTILNIINILAAVFLSWLFNKELIAQGYSAVIKVIKNFKMKNRNAM